MTRLRTLAYAATFEPGDEAGIVVSFPDVPEAVTQGNDEDDARSQAAEALALALLTYLRQGRALPRPRAKGIGLRMISLDPDDAGKVATIEAFNASGLTKSELGRRLGKDEREVRRILDPMHATKLPALMAALEVLGRRLVVGVQEFDTPLRLREPATDAAAA